MRGGEVRTANRSHSCICGGSIGRGDEYVRKATPPWALGEHGDGRWIVLKLGYCCSGSAT